MTTYDNRLILDARDTEPVRQADGTGGMGASGTTRGEQKVQEITDEWYAIQGNFVLFSTAAAGTGTASQASVTAYDGAKDVLQVYNGQTPGANGRSLLLRSIRMFVEVVPGGSGSQKYEFGLDSAGATARSAGSGTALTLRNVNPLATWLDKSSIVATVGAMTSVAQTGTRSLVYDGQIRFGVGLAADVFLFTFGDHLSLTSYLDPATTVGQQKHIPHGPLIIPPGYALRMQHYGASLSTAATIQWRISGVLR